MAIRSSLFVQNSGPTGVIDVEEARVGLGALVMPSVSALKAKSGFRPAGGASPGLVTATGTPDGFVHVAPFQLLLQGGRATVPGVYAACADAIVDINILSTPADPTNPRDDLIVAQQSDTFYGDANSDFQVRHVVGTPSGTPADPAVSGSGDYITLARVRVDAAATTITSGKITDLRTGGHANSLTGGLYSVALGGTLPVASQAQRDALTSLFAGMRVYRSDLKIDEVYDGATWKPVAGTLIGHYIQTSAQSVPNNAQTALQFNGTDLVDLYAAHDPATNNTRFTAPFAGRFSFSGLASYVANATGVRDAVWRKNSGAVSGGHIQVPNNGAGPVMVNAPVLQMTLAASDIVELSGFQNSGGPLNTDVANDDQPFMCVWYEGG